MITITNKLFSYFFSVTLLVATGCFAYWQNFLYLIIPVIVLLAMLLIQHPRCLFYLLILSIPWSVEFNLTPALGTDLPDEPLMILASLAVLLLLVYRIKFNSWKAYHPLIIIIFLQFVWMLFTIVTSANFLVSIKYALAKSWYLLAFLALPLHLFKDEKVLRNASIILLLSMMGAIMFALIKHGQYWWTFESVNDALKPFFRNHVNYSALLVFMVPVQIACLQITKGRIRNLFYAMLILTLLALYFSYARGAWLALAGGIAAYWLLKKKLLLPSFLFLICLFVSAVFWIKSNDRFEKFSNDYKTTIFHPDFGQHMIATYRLKDLSNAERVYRWVAGIRMVKDSWKTGFGPSTFYDQYKPYTLPSFKTYVSNNPERSTVHNYFLLMLIEQGIIGCLLFIVLLGLSFWYCQKIYLRTHDYFWRAVVAAIASILAMQCIINFLSDMIETDKVGSIFYLCIATLIIADIKTNDGRSDSAADIQRIS